MANAHTGSLGAAAPAGAGAVVALGLAVLATALPVMLHLTATAVGVAMCFVLGLVIANFATGAVPVVLVFCYMFQNLFVALVSPQIISVEQFNAIRAYNFVLTVAAWAALAGAYWLTRERFDPRARVLMTVTTLALMAVGLYFAIGLTVNPASAMVYLRNIAAPLLLFQIFLLVAQQHRVAVTAPLVLLASAALLFGYLELVGQDRLFRLINGDAYLRWRMKNEIDAGIWLKQMRETGLVYRSYVDAMMVDFLNTPWSAELGLRFYRLVGPNFHSISYAYVLAIFSVMLAAMGWRWFALLAFPALLVIGSKGALVFVLLLGGALALVRRARGFGPVWAFSAVLAAYAAAGIVIGIETQDYHVIGFIGGLNGFLHNPLGHGIGAGGNLSLDMTAIDWNRSQKVGSTDVAVESAVGVLLYQMGMFGLVLFGVIGWIAARLWRRYLETRERLFAAAALGLLAITVNGIFQEEALFSPLALGLLLALCGLLLGRAYRGGSGDSVPGKAAVEHR
jgi:hypothetical protein